MAEFEKSHIHSPCSQSNEMSAIQDRVGRSILATFIAALGPVSFGFCLGYSSSALLDLQSTDAPSAVRLSDDQASWFSSLVTIGAIFGSVIGGWVIDKLGRKGTIMFCTIPFVLGWLLICFAQSVAMLYSGRIITGLGCGTISLTVPVYIAEISAARIRGTLGSVTNLAITVGLILAYVAGVFCHWRWLAFIGAIPPTLQVILMFPVPETPRWLLGKGRRSKALESLLWLRGPDADIEEECVTIRETIDRHEKFHLRELLSPEIAKPLAISVGLMAFQMLSGVDVVEFNAAGIFATAGFSNGKLAAITVGLVQFVAAGLGCVLMDKVGRRILLWPAALGMCVSLVTLGVYFLIYIPPKDGGSTSDTVSMLSSISHSVPAKDISWLSILCIVLFNLMFSLAWGPVAWLVMAEINPLRVRGFACSLAALTNWSMAFVVTYTYNSMVNALTIQGTYWVYAGISFLGFLFVYFLLPETKGKTLEEIEAIFNKDKHNYERID